MSLTQQQLDQRIDIVAQHTPSTLRSLSLKELALLADGWLEGYKRPLKSVVAARQEICTQQALKRRLNKQLDLNSE